MVTPEIRRRLKKKKKKPLTIGKLALFVARKWQVSRFKDFVNINDTQREKSQKRLLLATSDHTIVYTIN